jgi:1-aminocyclopropane-1-carboxylate deaminase
MAFLQFPTASSLLQRLDSEYFLKKDLRLWMLRLDLLHPLVSGNKWLKLSGWLPSGFNKGIITPGGPWSNHVHAAAAYCHLAGMPFKAIINARVNMRTAMLDDVHAWGGEIIFANRTEFANHDKWQQMADGQDMLWIPTGGDGPSGVAGVKKYFDDLAGEQFDEIWCSAGTGTTVTGIACSGILAPSLVACIPGFTDPQLEQELTTLEKVTQRSIPVRKLPSDSFSKLSEEAVGSMNWWWQETGIPTDRIYTGKMIALFRQQLERQGSYHGKKVLLVHTGGLQGNRSLPDGVVKFRGE